MKPGGKRWGIPFLIGAGIVLAVVIYHFAGIGEPKYQGKTVNYWFGEYCESGQWRTYDRIGNDEAWEALGHLGTNAVPYLLKQAFNGGQDSLLQTNLAAFLSSLPRSWGTPVPVSLEERRNDATMVLRRLKPPADLVLPFLEREFQITNSPRNFQHRQAILVLGGIGDGAERAVPMLVAALKEPDAVSQRLALQSLGWIGPKAGSAVPALVGMSRSNSPLGVSALFSLGCIGCNAVSALPALREQFAKETNWTPRNSIAVALCRIDAGQTEALNYLTDHLTKQYVLIERKDAAVRLRQIGTNAEAGVPAIIGALDCADANLDYMMVILLRELGTPPEAFVPKLKSYFASDDPKLRMRAAQAVLSAVPGDEEARLVLGVAATDIGKNQRRAGRQ